MSSSSKNKNIRLTHIAWNQLRLLKFDLGMRTYSDVFDFLFNNTEELPDITPQLQSINTPGTANQRKDKTIVVNIDIHRRLADFKIKYLRQTEATSRGPGAVSISHVVVTLINHYKTSNA